MSDDAVLGERSSAPVAGPPVIDATDAIDQVCSSNLLGTSDEIIYFKDRDSRFIRVSAGCAAIHGRTPEQMVGLTDADLFDPLHARAARADEERIIATGEPMIAKDEFERWPDRSDTWVSSSKFPLRAPDGSIIGTFGISRDITRLVDAERDAARAFQAAERTNAELSRVEAQLRAVLDGSADAISHHDADLRYTYMNPAGAALWGSTQSEMLGRTDRESGWPEPSVTLWEQALRTVLVTGERGELDFAVPGPDGRDRWFHARLAPDLDDAGAVVGVLASTRDVTELKEAEQALARQALYDPVTGVANRYLLRDRTHQALVRMERYPGRLALFFIDLDQFKAVNDRHGHDVGDRVLVEVARRLERVARKEDTVARLGGDEFVVLCDRVLSDADAQDIASRLVAALAEPVRIDELVVAASGSVGAVVTDDPTTSPDDLLRRADAAMYLAKEAGRNRFAVHDPDAATPSATSVTESELHRALSDNQLRLLYQPLVSLSDQRLLGFEALVRWQHPERGLLAPGDFLPEAEDLDLIGAVGAWVLEAACAQLAAWDAHVRAGSVPLTMAVNVAGRQLREPGLVDQVRDVLTRHRLDPTRLTIELSERALAQVGTEAGRTLEELAAVGVRLAVDDFGATYTSLARLPHFPVSVVKLEQLDGSPWERRMVAAVIAMAHGLGMSVVGEGIETADQLAELVDLACDDGQGYLLSRPLDRADAERMLTASTD